MGTDLRQDFSSSRRQSRTFPMNEADPFDSLRRNQIEHSRLRRRHSTNDQNPQDSLYEHFPEELDAQESRRASNPATGTNTQFMTEGIVIVLMGVTGSGKSSFISLLADQSVEISHRLRSNTVSINVYSFTDELGGLVYLVDTPGFDDTTRSDAEILKDICYFLASIYANQVRLAGLIYLHRISDARMSGSAVKNLRLFKSLCGQNNFKHVALVTTMWSEMQTSDEAMNLAAQRQIELEGTYWNDMIAHGSKIEKHKSQRSSALRVIRSLIATNSNVILAIQRQLVDEEKNLDETDSGKIVYEEINTAKKKIEREIVDLQESLMEARREEGRQAVESIRAEQHALQKQADQRAQDGEVLRINIRQLAQEQSPRYGNLVNAMLHRDMGMGEPRPSLQNPGTSPWDAALQRTEVPGQEMIEAIEIPRRRHRSETGRQRPVVIRRMATAESSQLRRGSPLVIEQRRVGDARRQSPITQFFARIGSYMGYPGDSSRMFWVRRSNQPAGIFSMPSDGR